MTNKKNVYLLSFNGNWINTNNFIPVLWPSAKTFYELKGKHVDRYSWILPVAEFYSDMDKIKDNIRENPPDVLGVSLYVWNFELSLRICEWVKQEFPHCLIITGGPHQYFKHKKDWFSNFTFIDASLPSEVYGEIAITDILDNLREDNTVPWNKVEKIVYPSKNRKTYLQSPKATYKLDFDWNFSAFKNQDTHIFNYVTELEKYRPGVSIHCKIETTRGCPYECTFCDWGGGVGTKVIRKNISYVKDDIDVLSKFNLASIYVCDANFGINGDRDVEIVQYIADKKKESSLKVFPYVQYGGFAKTNKHFDYLKQIFEIEAKNNLSYAYKISQQTFQQDVLDHIKRTDVRENEHWDLARHLRNTYGYEALVELILGLPGMTVDRWYHEFDKPYEENVIARAYEWHLLPEAEAYEDEYRSKYKIKTAKKIINDDEWSIPSEIVVETMSYSREDYISFYIVYSIYMLFEQSGIYRTTIKDILKKNKIKFGDFLKRFHKECYPIIKKQSKESIDHFENHLKNFVSEEVNKTELAIFWNQTDAKILLWNYLILEYFKHFEKFDHLVKQWLIEEMNADPKKANLDSNIIHSEQRMNTKKRDGFFYIRYSNFKNTDDLLTDLDRSMQFHYGNILIAERSFLDL